MHTARPQTVTRVCTATPALGQLPEVDDTVQLAIHDALCVALLRLPSDLRLAQLMRKIAAGNDLGLARDEASLSQPARQQVPQII